jgi:hypothetical protein
MITILMSTVLARARREQIDSQVFKETMKLVDYFSWVSRFK